jgi:hypothetical protein
MISLSRLVIVVLAAARFLNTIELLQKLEHAWRQLFSSDLGCR